MDKNFQTVFDDAVELEKSFDTMFGGEEDDDLIGIVLGESGDEEVDFETLDDGETADELKKDLEGEEIEKPTIDSNGSFDIEDDSKTPGEDIACTKYGVADAVEKKAPDEENIEDEIEKSESKSDIDDLEESAFLDMILGEETADPGEPDELGVEKDQIEDNDEAEKLEDNNNPVNATADDEEKVEGLDDIVNKEGEGCEDGSCVAPDEVPVAYDHPVEDENLDDTFKDDDDDDDDDEDDDDEEPVAPSDNGEVAPAPEVNDDIEEAGGCGKAKKEEGENIPEPASDEGKNDSKPEDVEASLPPVDESANLDNIFGLFNEADEATTEEEKVEDEIIADVEEDEGELSDEEVAELTSDDDDDLLDMILGEE